MHMLGLLQVFHNCSQPRRFMASQSVILSTCSFSLYFLSDDTFCEKRIDEARFIFIGEHFHVLHDNRFAHQENVLLVVSLFASCSVQSTDSNKYNDCNPKTALHECHTKMSNLSVFLNVFKGVFYHFILTVSCKS